MSEYVVETLRELCMCAGVGGQRGIADAAYALLKKYTDCVQTDAVGNIIATIQSTVKDAPTVLLEAHMDEIGFIVTAVNEQGFLKVSACGGVDYRCLAATRVTVWGNAVLEGVFCSMPPHLQDEKSTKSLSEDALYTDVGLSVEEAKKQVPIGSFISFQKHFERMHDTCICANALDNRAGMTAVLYALSLLDATHLPFTVKVLFATGEELGCRGAGVGAFCADASAAIVTDVSFALTPDAPKHACGKMGEGAMLGIAPTLTHTLTMQLKTVMENQNIPFQTEVCGGKSGTDADVIGTVRTGIPTALLSIPLKYMHTPVEMVNIRDICAVGEAMAALISEGVI